MMIFEVCPRSDTSGRFVASWFDDAARTWDCKGLRSCEALRPFWPLTTLLLCSDSFTSVLFNPHAFAVDASIAARLSEVWGLELLPIQVEGEEYFILHSTVNVPIGKGFEYRRSSVAGGNVVQILAFPLDFSAPAPLFAVRHLPDSPAGRAGLRLPQMYASVEGKELLESLAGDYLELRPA